MSNRILFSSICDGEIYSNWALICIQSFKALVKEPVIWEMCTSEEWEDRLKNKLAHLEDKNLQFIYSRLGSVENEVDINKYITLGWTSYKSADYFMWRIKHLDELKASDKWDIVITIDLDSLFIQNPMDLVHLFIESGLTYGGTREPFNPEISFKIQSLEITDTTGIPLKTYFNLGFGFLNLNKLPENMWEMYKELSKDKEDWFNTQDQSFFSYVIDDSEKLILDNAQIVAHCLWRKEYNINRTPRLIHFSPQPSDMWNQLNSKHIGPYHLLKLKYYKKFAELAEKNKKYIPDTYLKNIKANLTFVKSAFMLKASLIKTMMDFYKI